MPMEPSNAGLSATRLGRTPTVWLALVGAMTTGGGLLVMLDGQPTPSLDGVALVASAPRSASIEAIFNTREPVEPGRWDGIVIYDSGSMQGSASSLATEHKSLGLHGLGYHFVIGNGSGSSDGELHVGYRWLGQAPGAHSAGPQQDEYNRRYIGVCLVGDGDRRQFTERQVARLVELVRALQDELGLPERSVLLGRDVSATSSPGRFFPETMVRQSLAGM